LATLEFFIVAGVCAERRPVSQGYTIAVKRDQDDVDALAEQVPGMPVQ